MLLLKLVILTFFILLNFLTTFGIDLGDKCSSNYYCWYIANAECRNNICQCMEGTTQYGEGCLEDVNPKIACPNSNECYLLEYNSICVDGYCRCPIKHHFRDGKCHYNKHLREPCTEDKECYLGMQFVGSMICKNFRCNCNNGYHSVNSRCRNGSIKNIPGFSCLLLLVITSLTKIL
ncbi:prion-like-(Q/N-rich) domain-bearing protein 25 isoform X2 [Onthophagus taurus]|uniref:prion-like-(Q/N-rich) domain-bearing protein 25 isoform X2 n=1 Tax=Onthophagus taurus TaxID=166361 RepID=UPI0039BDEB84